MTNAIIIAGLAIIAVAAIAGLYMQTVRLHNLQQKSFDERHWKRQPDMSHVEYSEGTGWPFDPPRPTVGAGRMHRMFDN